MALSSRTKPTPHAPLAGVRILVVDDHAFTVGLIKDVLYANGAASVQSALDGSKALDMLRSFAPDLIVTDWRMPGMDGLAFTQAVRRAGVRPDARVSNPQVPIILLSAHASAEAVEIARRAGVSEVVVKPFTIATLVERLVASVTHPREFVTTPAYIGPDRRRREAQEPAARRRASDQARSDGEAPPPGPETADSILEMLKAQLDAVETHSVARPASARRRR
jgi:CheY-like chemotaxis protein